MKKINLSIVMMLITICAYAQELPNIIPSPPHQAAIGKYVDMPVDLSYGMANVSIPFFSINCKNNYSLPISLSYHPSGIKVNEIATSVGLGWNLNSGGEISRSVRGLPDDYSNNGYINTSFTVNDFLNTTIREQINIVNPNNGYVNDFQSDVYSISIPGYRQKFFFNQSGEILGQPTNDLKINYIQNQNGNIIKWVVNTPDGNKFYFGRSKDNDRVAVDKTTSYTSRVDIRNVMSIPDTSPGMDNISTSWKLMDIETFKGDLISFNYETSNLSFWNLIGDQREFSIGNGTSNSPFTTFYSFIINTQHRISTISSNKQLVNFIYNTYSREDLDGDFSLQSIKLSYDNILVKQFNLEYDYFISPSFNQSIGKENQCQKRLFLSKIHQLNENNPYEFIYNTNKILPNRLSKSIDFWGYYNGENNSVLHPAVNLIHANIPGGERKVNEEYSKACILKEIKYPTKGKVKYFYESNNAANVNLINLTKINEIFIDSFSTKNMFQNEEVKELTINNVSLYEYGINFKFQFTKTCSNKNAIDCPKIRVLKYNFNTNTYELFSESKGVNSEGNLSPTFLSDNILKFKIELVNYSNFFNSDGNDVTVSVFGKKPDLDIEYGGKTGGLRIKRIEKLNSNGDVLLSKRFSYTSFNDSNVTSGLAKNPPVYIFNTTTHGEDVGTIPVGLVKSNCIFPITNGSGYSTVYNNVTEYNSNEEYGKTEYEYSYAHDFFSTFKKSLYYYQTINLSNPPATFIDGDTDYLENPQSGGANYRIGNLKSKREYKYINGGFSLKKSLQNKYSLYDENNSIKSNNLIFGTALYNTSGGYSFYSNISEPFHLESVIVKEYFDDKIIEVKNKYLYEEGYLGRTFPLKTIKSINDGERIITETKYAHDVGDQRLISEHRITEPIETIVYKEDEKISHQKTVYSDTHNSSGLYLPFTIQGSKGTQALEDRIVYHSYDESGNPQEVSQADGPKIYYIWGYDKTQPIAKIEGYSDNDISSASSIIQECITASNNDVNQISENTLRTKLSDLRTALPSAQVSTYTYDPLIGVTSITDPRGETIYYEYDEFNRLKFVKDSQENILKQHQYNYKD